MDKTNENVGDMITQNTIETKDSTDHLNNPYSWLLNKSPLQRVPQRASQSFSKEMQNKCESSKDNRISKCQKKGILDRIVNLKNMAWSKYAKEDEFKQWANDKHQENNSKGNSY